MKDSTSRLNFELFNGTSYFLWHFAREDEFSSQSSVQDILQPSFGQEQSLGCSSGKAGAEMNYNADLFCVDKALPGTDSLQRAQIELGVK